MPLATLSSSKPSACSSPSPPPLGPTILEMPYARSECQSGGSRTFSIWSSRRRPGSTRSSAARNIRTDLGELAGRALGSTLTQAIGDRLPGLFETTADDVRLEARGLTRSSDIAVLTRGFFTTLTQSALSYWLERTLSDHVGPGGSLGAAGRRGDFDVELRGFSYEATRIIKEFSGGWYRKHLHEAGTFSTRDAASFGAVCLKKTLEELRVRWAENA